MSALTSLTANTSFTFVGTEPLLLDSQSLVATPTVRDLYSMANGLVAVPDAIDIHYGDFGRTLTTGASRTYTLSALTDTLPRSIPFTKIRAVILQITSRTAGDYLTYGPDETNGWTALVGAGVQRCYRLNVFLVDKTDSLAVASGSNDKLTITNAGSGSITYNLLIAGNSG